MLFSNKKPHCQGFGCSLRRQIKPERTPLATGSFIICLVFPPAPIPYPYTTSNPPKMSRKKLKTGYHHHPHPTIPSLPSVSHPTTAFGRPQSQLCIVCCHPCLPTASSGSSPQGIFDSLSGNTRQLFQQAFQKSQFYAIRFVLVSPRLFSTFLLSQVKS